jgi:alpha-galactosidase/6-phospho-beta-glucosidase family protein
MKIAIIGGGSFLWTPGFVRQFAKSEFLHRATVSLMDIDPGNRSLVFAACDRFNRSQRSPLKLEQHLAHGR